MTTAYDARAKFLHWLVAPLLLLQFVVSYLMPHIGRNTVAGTLINLHFSCGVLIFVLMLVRFVARLRNPVPLAPAALAWENFVALTTHRAIYFILLLSPFLGWASASSHNLKVNVFGIFTLPDLVEPRTEWANTAGDVHGYLMWTLLGLVGLHIAAALFHQFIQKDGVLLRMLPARVDR